MMDGPWSRLSQSLHLVHSMSISSGFAEMSFMIAIRISCNIPLFSEQISFSNYPVFNRDLEDIHIVISKIVYFHELTQEHESCGSPYHLFCGLK